MKKLLFGLSILGMVAMVSCKDAETKTEEATETEATGTEETTVTETETADATSAVEVPKFSNEEVQKFADDYAAYYADVIAVTKSGDAAKIAELQTKATEWATKTQSVMTKMSPDDAKKWGEFATALATSQANAAK